MSRRIYIDNNSVDIRRLFMIQCTILAAIFLPFTKALTVDIGFPLKFYEVLFSLAILFFIFQGTCRLNRRVKRIFTYAIFFWIATVISYFSGLLNFSVNISSGYRGGHISDGAMRCFYLLFNLFVLLLATQVAGYQVGKLIKAWFAGFILAFCYHIYTVVSVSTSSDAVLLPGLERHQMGWIGQMLIPRSGTFEEGNFAGLYYLATLALALHKKYRIFAVLAIIAVILTLSTAAYVALVIIILFLIFKMKGKYLRKFFFSLILLAVTTFSAFQLNMDEKFLDSPNASGAVRLNESMTGLAIFFTNPIVGVGLGGYGLVFDEFEWSPELSKFSTAEKRIPNNVYVELLSETGILGALLFITFFVSYTRNVHNSPAFFAFGLAAAVAWLAYPTFNITYMWFFMGLSLTIARQKKVFLNDTL